MLIAQVAVRETPDTPQEKSKIKQNFFFSCMKSFASYSRRFKLNFEQKKRFSEKFTLVLPHKILGLRSLHYLALEASVVDTISILMNLVVFFRNGIQYIA